MWCPYHPAPGFQHPNNIRFDDPHKGENIEDKEEEEEEKYYLMISLN
jgi:hypothetical protein